MLWGYYDCLLDLLEKIIDTDQYQASLSVRHSIIHTIALKTSIDSSRAASLCLMAHRFACGHRGPATAT